MTYNYHASDFSPAYLEAHPHYRDHIIGQYQKACQNVEWAVRPYYEQMERIALVMPKTLRVVDGHVEEIPYHGWPQWAIDGTEQMQECIRYIRKSILTGWGFPDVEEALDGYTLLPGKEPSGKD